MREAVSSRQGLTEQEAQSRLQTHGPNELAGDPRPPVWRIFLSQYLDIMTGILLACTAISLLMGEVVEAVSIAVIVLLNGLLGFFQEYRTEKTLSALKAMAAPTARVLRDGKPVRLPASLLVPGDVVTLTAGDRIPADGRLFDAASFRTDESLLTGEAAGVAKTHDDPVFMGCTVTEGRGTMEVTGTGMDTEMGRIAGMLRTIRPAPTPLQVKLAGLSRWIAAGCLLICGVVTLTGLLRGGKLLDMLLTGVSLAVAAVPEGLPAIVTVSLALAVRRMVERRALVRRLHAVEALGCATVICSDKTGTITQNRMTVTALSLPDGEWNTLPPDRRGQRMCQIMTYCNNASLSPDGDWGSATELALLRLAKGHSLSPMKRLSEQPFDSTRKRMSVVAEDQNGGRFTLCKGGCESVLSHCTFWEDGEGVHPLTAADKARFLKETQTLAGKALRVIALAYRPGEGGEEELIFLGLLGLMDPPREGVKEAVRSCRRAGIRTIMITGDHPATACAIGAQVGIFREGDGVFTGDELDRMDEKALAKAAKTGTVFARVSPRHKLLLVRALKAQGELVAMTGDGVNDAPAVKEADIGVAMGKSGSDVTREAADLLLLDDNFATLVGAVDEGRSIYGNIRKFIRYLLSCNIGEVITMFFGMLFGMPVVLLPIQILLINLVTDGLPAIALGLEPRDPNAMCRPPRKPGESIFAHGLGGKICFRGFLIGLSTLASFTGVFRLTGSVDAARTGALITLVMAQLIHVFECKSEEVGLFSVPFFNNKKLLLAVLFSLAVLFAVVYLTPLQVIFSTVPLTAAGLALSLGLAALVPVVTAWKR